MRKVLRYSSLLVFLFLLGFGKTHASQSETTTHYSQISRSTSSEGEKAFIKVAPMEVREEEEDKNDSTLFGKFIECSTYFNNALPQGDFFSQEENIPVGNDLSHASPDHYLLLRVFRI